MENPIENNMEMNATCDSTGVIGTSAGITVRVGACVGGGGGRAVPTIIRPAHRILVR